MLGWPRHKTRHHGLADVVAHDAASKQPPFPSLIREAKGISGTLSLQAPSIFPSPPRDWVFLCGAPTSWC
jgi:hypothetical protein